MRQVCARIAAASWLLLFPFLTIAQSDLSTITGTIKDPSGSAVPNAKLIARNEATGVERKTTSSESGSFSVTNLPSGRYTVTVEAAGFKKYTSSGNKLDANSTPTCR
jgi:Carboxypeptidase regulatory-like domain